MEEPLNAEVTEDECSPEPELILMDDAAISQEVERLIEASGRSGWKFCCT